METYTRFQIFTHFILPHVAMTAGEILKIQFEGISNPTDTIEILNRNVMTKKLGLLPPITRIDEEDEYEDEDEDETSYSSNYSL